MDSHLTFWICLIFVLFGDFNGIHEFRSFFPLFIIKSVNLFIILLRQL